MKIHELAKELGVQSNAIRDYLLKEGADVKNHMSNIPENLIDITRNAFNKRAQEKVNPEKKPQVKVVAVPEFLTKMLDKDKEEKEDKSVSQDVSPEKEEKNKTPDNTASADSDIKQPKQPVDDIIKRPKVIGRVTPVPEKPKTEQPKPAKPKTENKPAGEKKVVRKQRIPARERIPDDELKEMREKAQAEKDNAKKAGVQKPVKKNEEKSKESEAAKSLREKLVKGKVSVNDIPANTNKKTEKDRVKNKDSKTYTKNTADNKGQQQAQNQVSQGDKRQGGKGKHNKYEKKRGDKFDRLENEKAAQKSFKQAVKAEPEEEVIKVIELPETISIKDFAARLKLQPSALIKKLFLEGKVYTVNDIIDYDTAEEIALGYDIISEHEVVIDYIEELLKEEDDPEESLVKRPPVVCVMGHVDHGKTSLLDAIRKTNVISGEAGGITQHIGAYTVELKNGEKLTFLDTPGHEAFTAMRLRGAKSTDVAILVVAADDGVMPQTIEAINHAKAADIHVIVAINKIDKPGANIDRVKQELADQGLIPEDWGGNTIFVPISAKQKIGIEELLEMVILDTEILELKANPNRMARGIVIEAKLDKGRGTVSTLLVQKGTLKIGDHIAMGEAYGKVRAMINDKGERIKSAGPSTPVEITGLSAVPNAGDTFVAFDNDKDAKHFAQVFIEENKKKLLAGTKSKMNLEDVFDQMKAGELKELDIIIKADVQGSAEAMRDSLEKLSNDEVIVKVIHAGVGNVSESDAVLASASNAIIIAFNVSVNADARMTIEHEKIDLRNYKVIYNAIDDVELAMRGMLEPIYEEVITGHVEVRQTFKASGVGIIAGSYVLDGVVKRDSKIRLTRGDEMIYEGSVASLKRFSDDAREVKSGFECGIVLDDFTDIKEGDIMEAYEMKEVARV